MSGPTAPVSSFPSVGRPASLPHPQRAPITSGRSSCWSALSSILCLGPSSWRPGVSCPLPFTGRRPSGKRDRRTPTKQLTLRSAEHASGEEKATGEPRRRHETSEPKVPDSVRVLLSGGPDWVAVPTVWEVASLRDEPKVKILCGNAYEHFEFSGSYSLHEGEQLPVYQWCRRTYVAE
ncbi:DUF5988 family protein [Streptomyces sp. NPDC004658]|uniref:DUF5988 family protein n=1 Tax=Streptomyces sp. NPDC004658 TaxID=3154672 RepID=UPI00339E9568